MHRRNRICIGRERKERVSPRSVGRHVRDLRWARRGHFGAGNRRFRRDVEYGAHDRARRCGARAFGSGRQGCQGKQRPHPLQVSLHALSVAAAPMEEALSCLERYAPSTRSFSRRYVMKKSFASTALSLASALSLFALSACGGASNGVPSGASALQSAAAVSHAAGTVNLGGEYSGPFNDNAYGKGKGSAFYAQQGDSTGGVLSINYGSTTVTASVSQVVSGSTVTGDGRRHGQPLLQLFNEGYLGCKEARAEGIVHGGLRLQRRARDLYASSSATLRDKAARTFAPTAAAIPAKAILLA